MAEQYEAKIMYRVDLDSTEISQEPGIQQCCFAVIHLAHCVLFHYRRFLL